MIEDFCTNQSNCRLIRPFFKLKREELQKIRFPSPRKSVHYQKCPVNRVSDNEISYCMHVLKPLFICTHIVLVVFIKIRLIQRVLHALYQITRVLWHSNTLQVWQYRCIVNSFSCASCCCCCLLYLKLLLILVSEVAVVRFIDVPKVRT